uniref:Uncharacterized protein n=1 Tax=Timema poppense TaxID=170557 RepID=A0A7R9DMN0_TIMPO|nr:unnamed protein product [Timema poppensis]
MLSVQKEILELTFKGHSPTKVIKPTSTLSDEPLEDNSLEDGDNNCDFIKVTKGGCLEQKKMGCICDSAPNLNITISNLLQWPRGQDVRRWNVLAVGGFLCEESKVQEFEVYKWKEALQTRVGARLLEERGERSVETVPTRLHRNDLDHNISFFLVQHLHSIVSYTIVITRGKSLKRVS